MTLADIADLNPATDISNLAPTDLVSFVPMSDVSDDGRWLSNDARPLEAVRRGYTAFREGDVLFAKITPCMENGKGCRAIGLIKGVGFGSTEFHVLRPKANADLGYVFQWTRFKELRQQAANAMTGSAGQQRVPEEFLRRFPITEHRPEERSRIADILELVDRAIEQTGALLTKQQRVKAGLMHDLLTRGLDAQGRLRDPATHKFKPSRFGPIPNEWDIKPLAECTKTTITYGIVQAGQHVPGGVPYIRTGDMDGDALIRDNMLCTSPDIASRFKRSEVRVGEIVCAIRATIGKVLPVPAELDGANLTQGTARISPNENVDGRFLLWSLRAYKTQQQMNLQSKGTTFAEITLTDLRRTPVAVAKLKDEQILIAKLIDQADLAIFRTRVCCDKLRLQKTGLMQDLLTGRVPVTPLLAITTN